MPIVQQAAGTWTGTSFTPTLPGASSASNCVVVMVSGNTTVTTPASWTLRTSQVNLMGQYLFDRAAFSLTSIAMTSAAGQGTWWIAEIQGGSHTNSTGQNAGTGFATTYNTPNLIPTAGTRIVLAVIGGTTGSSIVRTVSGWTNSFVEQADQCQASVDYPTGGYAALDNLAADGTTAQSTTATFSATSDGRTSLIGSYVTSAGGAAPAIPPIYMMAPLRH